METRQNLPLPKHSAPEHRKKYIQVFIQPPPVLLYSFLRLRSAPRLPHRYRLSYVLYTLASPPPWYPYRYHHPRECQHRRQL